jgi:hypothetical protein
MRSLLRSQNNFLAYFKHYLIDLKRFIILIAKQIQNAELNNEQPFSLKSFRRELKALHSQHLFFAFQKVFQ